MIMRVNCRPFAVMPPSSLEDRISDLCAQLGAAKSEAEVSSSGVRKQKQRRHSNRTGCLRSLSTAFPVAQICSFSGGTSNATMNAHSFCTTYRYGPVRAAR
jgi:hypothetical protein